MTVAANLVTGRHVLLVEDDYFIAEELAAAFKKAGAMIVGPVGSVAEALELVSRMPRLDGAVLDINLRGQDSFAVGDLLASRGVPFVFASGYDRSIIPPRHALVKSCEKPVNPMDVAVALFGQDRGAPTMRAP